MLIGFQRACTCCLKLAYVPRPRASLLYRYDLLQVFSVLLSAPLLGQAYPPIYVWGSLLPIIGQSLAVNTCKEDLL